MGNANVCCSQPIVQNKNQLIVLEKQINKNEDCDVGEQEADDFVRIGLKTNNVKEHTLFNQLLPIKRLVSVEAPKQGQRLDSFPEISNQIVRTVLSQLYLNLLLLLLFKSQQYQQQQHNQINQEKKHPGNISSQQNNTLNIVSWYISSLKPTTLQTIKQYNPRIICLQEIRQNIESSPKYNFINKLRTNHEQGDGVCVGVHKQFISSNISYLLELDEIEFILVQSVNRFLEIFILNLYSAKSKKFRQQESKIQSFIIFFYFDQEQENLEHRYQQQEKLIIRLQKYAIQEMPSQQIRLQFIEIIQMELETLKLIYSFLIQTQTTIFNLNIQIYLIMLQYAAKYNQIKIQKVKQSTSLALIKRPFNNQIHQVKNVKISSNSIEILLKNLIQCIEQIHQQQYKIYQISLENIKSIIHKNYQNQNPSHLSNLNI